MGSSSVGPPLARGRRSASAKCTGRAAASVPSGTRSDAESARFSAYLGRRSDSPRLLTFDANHQSAVQSHTSMGKLIGGLVAMVQSTATGAISWTHRHLCAMLAVEAMDHTPDRACV